MLMIMTVTCHNIRAQSTTIHGTITDEQTGEALPFAYVSNLSSDQATITDIQGRFSINAVSEKDSLLVSIMGYQQNVLLAKQNMIIGVEA
jgi:hypothetical protein